MKNIHLLLFSLVLLCGQKLFSQDFVVPDNYKFVAAEDYKIYEKDIIAAANWLIAIPFNEQTDKRRRVSAFVVEWIIGSPTVNVEINETITNFENKNKGMLTLYMAGCAKYVLENNYTKDKNAKYKAALHYMIDVYKKGKGITKDKKMDKLIKSDEDGKLNEWLKENMNMG